MRRLVVAIATTAALACPVTASAAPKVPQTVVLDGARLAATRAHPPAAELGLLRATADGWLAKGPWTVTSKPQTPPSGDKHDYLSEAPYWWPTQPKTAANPWGCPYIQKDGQRYPGVDDITDHAARGDMFNAVYYLTLAWYYTGSAKYAERAALDLRTWFVTKATRMNPNLNYTQMIPCQVDGRGTGIIDFSQQFTDILDATAILDTGAPGWTTPDHAGMTSWYKQFLSWLRTSSNAADEAAATNNHGSFFDMQEAALALATGQKSLAQQIVRAARAKRLDVQLAADGSQPLEISRTRSFHYSTFNLVALTRLAMIGKHVGVDLWGYKTSKGGSIKKSVDFLIPAATGVKAWPYPELQFQAFAATDDIHAAADAGDSAALKAKPPAPPDGDIWKLRPATEQLDPITS